VSQALQICRQEPRLFGRHMPQLHTLLGLYAMSMNCMEAAEAQFSMVLRVSFPRITLCSILLSGTGCSRSSVREELRPQLDVAVVDSNPILHSFQLLLLEHIAMCRLVMGNKTLAIQE
ncbi:MAU2 chromatid cohesion factor homolog, partial [Ixodes scapularis]